MYFRSVLPALLISILTGCAAVTTSSVPRKPDGKPEPPKQPHRLQKTETEFTEKAPRLFSAGNKQALLGFGSGSGIRITAAKNEAVFGDVSIYLTSTPEYNAKTGKWTISETDMGKTVIPLLRNRAENPKPRRIMLDPGHGGQDGGAIGAAGHAEKQINLKIAKLLRQELLKRGYQAELTRSDDRFIPLEERPRLAAIFKADIFISIHSNAQKSGSINGIETYALTPRGAISTNGGIPAPLYPGHRFDNSNILLATAIHRRMRSVCPYEDRGVRRAQFKVLTLAESPAALVECGYLSNRDEERLLSNDKYLKLIAGAIADGIEDYAGICDQEAEIK